MHHRDKYSEHDSIIWSVWPNDWVFVYELSGSGFESSCSQLNFRFCACFEKGVPWHSGNYRVLIHAETRTWHDKNIQIKSTITFKILFQCYGGNSCDKLQVFIFYCLRLVWTGFCIVSPLTVNDGCTFRVSHLYNDIMRKPDIKKKKNKDEYNHFQFCNITLLFVLISSCKDYLLTWYFFKNSNILLTVWAGQRWFQHIPLVK